MICISVLGGSNRSCLLIFGEDLTLERKLVTCLRILSACSDGSQ